MEDHLEQRNRMCEQMGRAMGTIRYATIRLERMMKHTKDSCYDKQDMESLLKLMQESHNILEEK